MAEQSSLPVVVGVDGSEQSRRAVRYAVAEARRRGAGLRFVHAVHETAPMTAMMPLFSVDSFTDVGNRLAEDAARLARDLDPSVRTSRTVKGGGRVGVLVEEGERASVIVLGHRSRSFAGRVLTSSTTTGVAARAHCPVVSVPDSWTPGDERGRVVVGLDDSNAARDALVLAFAEARRRRARLVVLHAWRLPTAYDDIGYSEVAEDQWMPEARAHFEETIAPFRDVYPEVDVEIELRHEFAGQALVTATEDADLIVVGRRGHGAPLGIYLGSLARMLVREAHCPVEIAPQHSRHEPTADERMSAVREDRRG